MERYVIPIALIIGQMICLGFGVYLTMVKYLRATGGDTGFVNWLHNWAILLVIFSIITILTSFFRINWYFTIAGYMMFLASVFTCLWTLIK